jgi:hypothetical protein
VKRGIWDLHCHFVGVPGVTPEKRAGNLVMFADRMGIERMCLFMGMNFVQDPTPAQLREANNAVLTACRLFPRRILGFVYLSPKHLQASLEEVERCIVDGPMVGIKLWVAQRCDTPEADRIVERAEELKALVFQHTWLKITGNLPGESTPMDLAALASRHPRAHIVCGHSGGDWETGLRTIKRHPNVYADLAGGDPVCGITEMAVRELGPERVLYGSDVAGRGFASQLAKVFGADIRGGDKRAILSDNLKRLLRPIMDQKGMKQ